MVDSNRDQKIKRALVTKAILSDLLSRNYGLRMLKYEEIGGYDDKNIWVDVDAEGTNENIQQMCRHGYVLKITNDVDSKNTHLLDAQHEIMSRVYRSGICTPRPVPSLTGRLHLSLDLQADHSGGTEIDNNVHVIHLYDFIPGMTLASVTLTEGLCYKVGVLAGRLDKTLEGLTQQVLLDHHWRWHLDQVPRLQGLLQHVQEGANRDLLTDIFKQFQSRVLNHMEKLSTGTIHTDFNSGNLLVSKRTTPDVWNDAYDLAAILDYGDCSISPYIFEIAIAMTHVSILPCNKNNSNLPPARSAGYVLSGYLSEMRLTDYEINLLKFCMCARAGQVLVMTADPTSAFSVESSTEQYSMLRNLWMTDNNQLVYQWRNIQLNCQRTLNKI